MIAAWVIETDRSRAVCTLGLLRAICSRRSMPSRIATVNGAASGFTASGSRASIRAWTPTASTTCWLIRVLSGSMTAGSATTSVTRAVNRSVLNRTWWVHTATLVTTIDRQARTRTKPARMLRRRRARGGGVASSATGSVAMVISSSLRHLRRIRLSPGPGRVIAADCVISPREGLVIVVRLIAARIVANRARLASRT